MRICVNIKLLFNIIYLQFMKGMKRDTKLPDFAVVIYDFPLEMMNIIKNSKSTKQASFQTYKVVDITIYQTILRIFMKMIIL